MIKSPPKPKSKPLPKRNVKASRHSTSQLLAGPKRSRSNQSDEPNKASVAAHPAPGTGVARVVAQEVDPPDDQETTLLLLLKLEAWRIVPIGMFGHLRDKWFDENIAAQREFAWVFELITDETSYRLQYEFDSLASASDQPLDELRNVMAVPIKPGSRLSLVEYDSEDAPRKRVFRVSEVHFI